jgi:hypothetical protein
MGRAAVITFAAGVLVLLVAGILIVQLQLFGFGCWPEGGAPVEEYGQPVEFCE